MKTFLAWVLAIITFIIALPFVCFISVYVFASFYSDLGIYNIFVYIISLLVGLVGAWQLSVYVFGFVKDFEIKKYPFYISLH